MPLRKSPPLVPIIGHLSYRKVLLYFYFFSKGGTHVHKARYLRLSFDSDPADIMNLMERLWGLERPRLVISVHGGTSDFK